MRTAQMDHILKALQEGTFPTMNGTPYVLIEFSQWVMPENTIPCIQELTKAGWKPIIAHIERYEHLQNMLELVDQFREMGCLTQLNAYSLVEEMDENIQEWARSLVLNQKIDFLGTDMHRTYYRPPSVETGLKWLYENCEKNYTDAVSFGNAQQLLCKTAG